MENLKPAPLKLVIYRPHANIWFKNPIRNIIRNKKLPNKYAPLLDFILHSDSEIYFASQFIYQNRIKDFLKSILDMAELIAWCAFNRINTKNVHFIFRKKSLLNKDALFLMHYGNLTHEFKSIALQGEQLARLLSKAPIYKIVHMTHYIYNIKIGGKNIETLMPNLLIAESNLKINSDFFKQTSMSKYDFLTLPYTPSSRFKKTRPFNNRKNKLVVTGSITYKIRDEDFIKFYKQNELQPMRRILYNNAEKYKQEMDCFISDLNATRINIRPDTKGNILSRFSNFFIKDNPQKKYYEQDIVATYNSYMMFAVPEEICGLPAIGFVEGMACGCAYIGIDSKMYRDIGLIPGVHYIAYDGTVFDLMEKVRYYQRNLDALESIAKRGESYVLANLNSNTIYEKFLTEIKSNHKGKKI